MSEIILKLGAVFFLMLAIFGCTPATSASDPQKPPVFVDFYPGKVGEVYTFDVKLDDTLISAIVLHFYITLPLDLAKPGRSYLFWHFFDKKVSPEESRKLHDILGGARRIAPAQWVEPGVPIKLRVQIIQKLDGKLMLDELVDHPKTNAAYMGRYTNLVEKYLLSPGVYTVRIEYLEGAPELAPLYGKISFSRAYTGK